MDPRIEEIEKIQKEIIKLENRIIVLKGYIQYLEEEIQQEGLADTTKMEIINVDGITNKETNI